MLEVELDVAVDVECDDGSRSGRDPDLLHREQREFPERALLPEGQDEEGWDDSDAERDPLTPAPCEGIGERRSESQEQVRGLEPTCRPE